jgi:acetyl-CoA C-acetyltransferase
MIMDHVVILGSARTAVGSFQGALSTVTAPQLGATAIKEALLRSGVSTDQVTECIMGEVLTAGVGQAPARQAALYAGLKNSTVCMTINKVCGSGLKAVMLGADSLRLGSSDVVVAGGQENMTLAPHLLENSRTGYRMGSTSLVDSMIKDGLWDPYNNFHMGTAAEICVKDYKFSRESQDEFAVNSYKKALKAIESGYFKEEIAAVKIETKKGSVLFDQDEEPLKVQFDKISSLRPAFDKEGTITAANASKINDGASAHVLMLESAAKQKSLRPMARIIAYSSFAHDPKYFTTAPVGAIKKALQMAQLKISDIDFFEINEAFSVVAQIAQKELEIPSEKLNPHGGAVAIGHPIGGSGARILTTLSYALKTHQKRYGLASLCIGGGEAVALIIERL